MQVQADHLPVSQELPSTSVLLRYCGDDLSCSVSFEEPRLGTRGNVLFLLGESLSVLYSSIQACMIRFDVSDL